MGYREAVLADNPSALWMMDEASGTAIVDAVAGLNATLYDTYTRNAVGSLVPGTRKPEISFPGSPANGTGGYAQRASDPKFSTHAGATGAMSVEMLVSITTGGQAFCKYAAGAYEFHVSFGTASMQLVLIQTAGTTVKNFAISSGIAADPAMHHVVFTYDAAVPRVQAYSDGVLRGESTTDFVGTTSSTGSPLTFAYSGVSTDGSRFGGRMGGVAYYGRVLTATEIARHYKAWARGGVSY